MHDTLILGAGLSGLYTAWRLTRAGHATSLVESRERLGGRIASVPAAPGAGHRFDLGPAWFWPGFNPRLQALIERLGLGCYVQHATGTALYEAAHGAIARLPDTLPQQPESHRINGGMASLVEALASRLDGVPVALATRAVGLELTGEGLAVRLVGPAGEFTRHARQVVSTLPPRLLAPLVAGQPGITPEFLASLNAAPTWMAGQAKFVACYPRAFWREAGLSGDAFSQRGPLGEIHDACDAAGNQAALFGFVGVAPPQRARLGEAALREHALAQLQRLFGAAAGQPVRVWLQDWAGEPDTATSADHAAVSQHPVKPAIPLPAPWASRLLLAGTEFAAQTGGYLEGALEAADAVVASLVRRSGQPPSGGHEKTA